MCCLCLTSVMAPVLMARRRHGEIYGMGKSTIPILNKPFVRSFLAFFFPDLH